MLKDLLLQGLDSVLLAGFLQGTHPVLKEITGEQFQGDSSEEVLEGEKSTPKSHCCVYFLVGSLFQTYTVLKKRPPLTSIVRGTVSREVKSGETRFMNGYGHGAII